MQAQFLAHRLNEVAPSKKGCRSGFVMDQSMRSGLAVNRQEVICRFEPGHRSDVTDAAVWPVPVVVVLPARQGMGPLS